MSNTPSTVWVVMGNDYPAGVFSTEEAAQAYCQCQTATNKLDMQICDSRRIYYRAYEFVLDQAKA